MPHTSLHTVKLSSGHRMPIVGLGTWQLFEEACYDVVKMALDLGYRHIDTAYNYQNEAVIGKAIAGFPRDQLFLTSKVPPSAIDPEDIQGSIETIFFGTLEALQTDYLDLYLLHAPDRSKPMGKVMQTLLQLKKKGKVRTIGVANCTMHHLQDLLAEGAEISVNQVEFHPFLYQKELLDFCHQNKITLQAYRSLGKGALVDHEELRSMAQKYKKTIPQIILRWTIQKEILVIPKASTPFHLKENLSLFDFTLTHADMHFLDTLNKNQRFCSPEWQDFNY